MTTRPILFSAPMVRALLAGRKTQTRRIVRRQPPAGWDRAVWYAAPVMGWTPDREPSSRWHKERCPYGVEGDALWVKETFAYRDREYHPEGGYWYAATDDYEGKSVSPLFMPRWASRITLRVTSVRVERLQAISESDAKAEGVDEMDGMVDDAAICRAAKAAGVMVESRAAQFGALWDSINGKRAPWASSPWVWVVGFEVVP